MSFQSYLRVLSVMTLQGLTLYEMIAIQSMSRFRWYDWVCIIVLTLLALWNIGGEFFVDEEDKQKVLTADDEQVYWFSRVLSLVIFAGCLWKLYSLQVNSSWLYVFVITCGLFAVFNFYYWIVSLLVAFGIFYVIHDVGFNGWVLYLSIAGIAIVGLVIMGIIANAINEHKEEIEWRIRAEREAREAREREMEERRAKEEAERRAREISSSDSSSDWMEDMDALTKISRAGREVVKWISILFGGG